MSHFARMNANLYALLAAHFSESAEQPCLLIPDRPVVHYDDLDAASARIAHALTAAGARPGDRVAAQVDKCWEALALYLACLRAGFVYLPLNTGYQKSELSYLFGDAEPSVIVCGPQFAERNAALRPEAQVLTLASGKGTLLDRADEQPETFDTVASKPDDVAAILYTSGTTGRPKGAMLTHRNLASNALTLVQLWGFTRGDVLLHALPIYHVHGLFVACHCALLSGARMLWLAKFDAEEVRALLPRATVMMGVPTFYTRLLALPSFGAADCRTVRLFVSGSAPLLAETFDEFRERTGHTILERYGMTETGMITSNPLDGERIARHRRPRAPRGFGARRRCRRPRLRRRGRRRRRGQGPERIRRLLAHAGQDARGIHRRRLFPDGRRRASCCRTAICASSAARRISSSPAGSTSIPRKSRRRSTRSPASSSPRSSACPTPISAKRWRRSSSRSPDTR